MLLDINEVEVIIRGNIDYKNIVSEIVLELMETFSRSDSLAKNPMVILAEIVDE